MKLLQNPILRTRFRLMHRTVGWPALVLLILTVTGVFATHMLADTVPCSGCDAEREAWLRSTRALTSFGILQLAIATLGPFVFGALFQVFDKRAGLEDAIRMAPLSDRQRRLGSALSLGLAPLGAMAFTMFASFAVFAMGPVPFGAEVVAAQLGVFGLAGVVSAIAARVYGSAKPRTSFLLVVALFWIGGVAAMSSGWWLSRLVSGADLYAAAVTATSFRHGVEHPFAGTLARLILTMSAQAGLLSALLFAPASHDATGSKRTLSIIAAVVAVQALLLWMDVFRVAPQLMVGTTQSWGGAGSYARVMWFFGALLATGVVALAMPTPESRYRSSIRRALGVEKNALHGLYARTWLVCAVVGAGVLMVGVLGLVAGGVTFRELFTSACATLIGAAQLCVLIAYYDHVALRRGNQAPGLFSLSILGLILLAFLGAAIDLESSLGILPGVVPAALVAAGSFGTTGLVGLSVWAMLGALVFAAGSSRPRTHVRW